MVDDDNDEARADYMPLAGLYAGADDDLVATAERRDNLDRPRTARTGEAVVLAFVPFLALLADAAVGLLTGGVMLVVVVVAVAVAASAWSISLARADQTRLAEFGHSARTQPYLALLPPVYLFIRGSRAYAATFEGLGIAWVSLVVLLVVLHAATVSIPGAMALGGMLREAMDYWQ